MVIEWKERGHEAKEHQATQDPNCIATLRASELLKFSRIHGIRTELELLQHLVDWWDVNHQLSIFGDHDLDPRRTLFLDSLLRWGELIPRRRGGQQMSFPPVFFGWLFQKLIMGDDWAYAGTNF